MKTTTTEKFNHDKLKILVLGESGSGKTFLASTIKEKTLIISAEAGLLTLADFNIDVIDITVDENDKIIPKEKRYLELRKVYQLLLTKEYLENYSWIYLDSLTEVSQLLVDELQTLIPDRKDSLVLWGEYSKRMRSLVKAFRDLPYNFVATGLVKVTQDELNRRFIGLDVAGKISGTIARDFDEVFYLSTQQKEDNNIERIVVTFKTDQNMAKDRSSKLDMYEKRDLSVIASKIRGGK